MARLKHAPVPRGNEITGAAQCVQVPQAWRAQVQHGDKEITTAATANSSVPASMVALMSAAFRVRPRLLAAR